MPRSSRLGESDADAIWPVAIGTAVWGLIVVGLVIAKPTLEAHGTTWWLGVALVGLASGAIGLMFLRWRRGRMRRQTSQE